MRVATQPFEKVDGANFTAAHLGDWTQLNTYAFKHPLISNAVPGKVFLKDALQLTGMEVSLNKLPPGVEVPFYHKHREHEELYIFTRGTGQFQVDGQVIDVHEGTVIRVKPDGVRTWRNDSTEDLYYIVIQAKAGTFVGQSVSDGQKVAGPVSWSG